MGKSPVTGNWSETFLSMEKKNNLILSKDKTKEIIMDFRKKISPAASHHLQGTEVDRVDS